MSTSEIRTSPTVEHPALTQFNDTFGAKTDLSRYETIGSSTRALGQEVFFLTQLQMDHYVPTRIALLLKNNLHDALFITYTTRSFLFELKQNQKIGEACFYFLHDKVNNKDFLTVYRYLYVLMLYEKIAAAYLTSSHAFAFETAVKYSDKLIQASPHEMAKEEKQLQSQVRRLFLKKYLAEIGVHSYLADKAKKHVFATTLALDNPDPEKFHLSFVQLLHQLRESPQLEKICFQELHSTLSAFQGEQFLDQAYLQLKAESYYKNCLAKVTDLRRSLENTKDAHLFRLSEKCKKAYNGCVYLLSDSKNIPSCSPTRFSAIIGKMRTEWQQINSTFNRIAQETPHRLCACQAQVLPYLHGQTAWPFHRPTLIDLKPSAPSTSHGLGERGISSEEFQKNQNKTVAVIGCKWGGGHMEVSRGIANNLTALGYHSITVDLPEVLMELDPVRNLFLTRWLRKQWSIASLFEGLLKEKAFAIINFLRWVKYKIAGSTPYSEEELKKVIQHLLKLNPDSVILTYMAHNESVIEACKILGIPCIQVATDIDSKIESRNKPTHSEHFKIGLPFNAPETIGSVIDTTTNRQRFFIGPPIRHPFTQKRTAEDVQRLKEKWSIDANKKVVVLSSGKNGTVSPYAEILARQYANTDVGEIPIHLVVICGNGNEKFKQHLESNIIPKTKLPTTVGLFYNEEQMEELMTMASYGGALVGKAGGATIFEAFARGTRILVDKVNTFCLKQGLVHFLVTLMDRVSQLFGFENQLRWEKANMEFAVKHGLARVLQKEKDFLLELDKLLQNDRLPVRLNLEIKNVEEEIPAMLRQMHAKGALSEEMQRARTIHNNL